MNVRVAVAVVCAAALLAGCGTKAATAPPQADGTGSPALNPSVALTVTACEPGFWCVAAGSNPAATTSSTAIETSAGGHGKWAKVAAPALSGAMLSAAGCWTSGCLLGGSSPSGTVVVLVNARRRVASALTSRPAGSGITALACTGPGRCLALVTTTTSTSVVRTEDSGASWTVLSTLPTALAVGTSLACASSAACVAVGTGPNGAGAAWTRDGGVRWTTGAVPHRLASVTSAACAPRRWCVATARRDDGAGALLRSANEGRSWSLLATSVADPDAVACTRVAWCVVAGGTASGGSVSTYETEARETPRTLAYVPDPILAIACATARKCVGITQESTVSFVS